MSTLLIIKLDSTPLDQSISIYEPKVVERVKVGLYKHLRPSGTFTISILDSDSNVLASKGLTIADMESEGSTEISGDYYHGFVSFIFDDHVLLGVGDYTLRLSSSGYTFSESAYIGWFHDWEHKVVNNESVAAADNDEPLAYRMYCYNRG